MSTRITVRIDDELARSLEYVSRRSGRTRSDIVREVLRRHLAVVTLESIRETLVPLAEAQGWYTDEDIFRDVS
jgi:predicted DNA-binding protein